MGEFVTYDLIEDVGRVRKLAFPLTRDDVVLVPMEGSVTRRRASRWRIPFKMVGVEGMTAIGEKVSEAKEREGRGPLPELVLYGPGGPGKVAGDRRSGKSSAM